MMDLVRAALGRTDVDPGRGSQEAPVDWDRLLDRAHRNAVTPLVAAGLRRCPGVPVPERAAGRLREHARQIALRNLFLAGELCKLFGQFQSHGVRAIAFKGPTLSVRAYGDLASREFLDLDVLVPASELERAIALAGELGYRCPLPVPSRDIPRRVRRSRQITLVRSGGRSMVELHTGFTSPGFAYHRDVELLWQEKSQVELGGKPIPVLRDEELFLLLCVHGGKHRWERLAWIADVAALVAAQTSFDWEYILERASQAHIQRLMLLAICLADKLAGLDMPGEIQRTVAGDRVVESLASDVWKRRLEAEKRRSKVAEAVFFDLRARERLRDGQRHVAEQIFSPTLLDYGYVPSGTADEW